MRGNLRNTVAHSTRANNTYCLDRRHANTSEVQQITQYAIIALGS
jgi:hypothetical protein